MLRSLLACALSAFALTGVPQAPRDNPDSKAATSAIRGRVVAANTGEPLRKARVALSSVPEPVFTDNEGLFAFTNLPAGRYTLTVRKTGYAATTFGTGRPGSPPISIDVDTAGGSVVDGIEVRMPKGAAISGHIVDQFGDPVEAASVSARRTVRVAGRMDIATQATTLTDDLGEYRLGGLPAGSFVVSALLPNSVVQGMSVSIVGGVSTMTANGPRAPTYYPGAPGLSRAQPIAVRAGDEASSIDFSVSAARLANVSITLVDATGNPVGGAATVARTDEAGLGAEPRSIAIRGSNTAVTLEPGEWILYANGTQGVGVARFSVGSDDASVTVPLVKGARVSGRVVVEGDRLPLSAAILIEAAPIYSAFGAPPTFGMTAAAPVKADGSFEMNDLVGTRQLRVRFAPPGWLVKAILFDGRNLLDSPIELKGGEDLTNVQVVLTSRLSTLKGAVTDAAKAPMRDFSVLIFPADEELQHARSLARWVRPNQNGEFLADDLVPGSYLAIAVQDVDESRWPDAGYLTELRARATPVTLGASEKKTITLEIGGAP